MNKKTRTFKCVICKDIITFYIWNKLNQLVDARKYIQCKIVCSRCYNRIREKNREIHLKTLKKNRGGSG